jgi:transposase-like protein
MASVLSAPHFHDEKAAYKYLEARVWPDGPVCPHCGGVERISAMKGASTRLGSYKCYQCRSKFTVKVRTVFESSHVALHIWLQAVALLTSSKKGMSANQLHRVLGVTLKTAWFMGHRIREAMRDGGLRHLGGAGSIVEADETYFGPRTTPVTYSRPRARKNWKPTKGGKSGPGGKRAIMALVERGGSVRSFHLENADKPTINRIIAENILRGSELHTDESRLYGDARQTFKHESVKHSAGEYVRGNVHANSAEGVFSIFKRGMKGIYQHCSEKHLHRYLAEFDFRYNNRVALGVGDIGRADRALTGIVGKRLTYRTTNQ